MNNGVGWTLEVNGIAYDLKATGEGFVEDAINNHPYLSTILKAFQQDWAGLSIANLTNEDLRIKLIPDSVFDPAEQTVWPTNPAWSVDELGVYSFCLSATKFELADMSPLSFHISTLDESDGWFEVDFWDVPLGSKLTVDWGDGSPIEQLISDTNNDGYLNPYHYYTSVDHVAKFTVDSAFGGWFCQSANIDALINFGDVEAGYIEIHKAYKLISVPAMLPEYINGIEITSCNLLNDSNISLWDTSHITTMINMFRNCTLFNQDLSGWCVPLILTEPYGFATYSSLIPEHFPVWGTCPN